MCHTPDFAQTGDTSAQAMGLAGRPGQARVLPWDKASPPVVRNGDGRGRVGAPSKKDSIREFEFEY
jgi:hypothetical protein